MSTNALILAAGRGSRMNKYTEKIPKCLLPFNGATLLDIQCNLIRNCGINEIHVVNGYRSDCYSDIENITLWNNDKWSETNMVYTMFCARQVLENSDRLLISYADIIYEKSVVEKILDATGDIVITVDRNWFELWKARNEDPLEDAESLRLNDKNEIIDIGRKITNLNEAQAQYIGLICFNRSGLNKVIKFYDHCKNNNIKLNGNNIESCYMTDFLSGMINEGYTLTSSCINGGWLEFDTDSDYLLYEEMLKNGVLSNYLNIEEMIW